MHHRLTRSPAGDFPAPYLQAPLPAERVVLYAQAGVLRGLEICLAEEPELINLRAEARPAPTAQVGVNSCSVF